MPALAAISALPPLVPPLRVSWFSPRLVGPKAGELLTLFWRVQKPRSRKSIAAKMVLR